ncbi:MAG: HIT family protein [Steroidobacteraceae bacterium]|jgi:diadenosine tetraphosphate (Ap4A) HIT family hydrolase
MLSNPAPASCPFCDPASSRIFADGPLAVSLWDGYPVSPAHALIIPRRHVATWFDATNEEQIALLEMVRSAKAIIEERHKPDGYNIGINSGAAAGQTVFHLHIHLIPRFFGDVEDPRGGVRHVIPAKANYTIGMDAGLPPDHGYRK